LDELAALPIDFLRRLAAGLAQQFGGDCEVLVHDLRGADPERTIAAIENGQVTHRGLGGGPSQVVLEALRQETAPEDQLGYLSRTQDGRILKSSTIYIRDKENRAIGILAINYDITHLLMAEKAIAALSGAAAGAADKEPARIHQNVGDLLAELIEQSAGLVGKPVALMTKEDKIQAIRFLNQRGAFLITKSGDKIAKYFNISKYTLYSYLDAAQTGGD
jgi:predicted transcriptional regulator YheO